jgi:hypothetical protein
MAPMREVPRVTLTIQRFDSDFHQIPPHGGHLCRAGMQFPLSGLLGTSTHWKVRPAGRTHKKAAL